MKTELRDMVLDPRTGLKFGDCDPAELLRLLDEGHPAVLGALKRAEEAHPEVYKEADEFIGELSEVGFLRRVQ